MKEDKIDYSLKTILTNAARDAQRVRLIGAPLVIIADGYVTYVSREIVALSNEKDSEPNEFVNLADVIKVQLLPDYVSY